MIKKLALVAASIPSVLSRDLACGMVLEDGEHITVSEVFEPVGECTIKGPTGGEAIIKSTLSDTLFLRVGSNDTNKGDTKVHVGCL